MTFTGSAVTPSWLAGRLAYATGNNAAIEVDGPHGDTVFVSGPGSQVYPRLNPASVP